MSFLSILFGRDNTGITDTYNTGHPAVDEFFMRIHEDSDGTHLWCEHYRIIRRTPKGVWLEVYDQKPKFVLASGNGKRFAYATRRDALHSFIKRKEWQESYAIHTINRAKAAKLIAQKLLKEEAQ